MGVPIVHAEIVPRTVVAEEEEEAEDIAGAVEAVGAVEIVGRVVAVEIAEIAKMIQS